VLLHHVLIHVRLGQSTLLDELTLRNDQHEVVVQQNYDSILQDVMVIEMDVNELVHVV